MTCFSKLRLFHQLSQLSSERAADCLVQLGLQVQVGHSISEIKEEIRVNKVWSGLSTWASRHFNSLPLLQGR